MINRTLMRRALGASMLSVAIASAASAQLGRQNGLIEPNLAPDSTLLKAGLPQMALDAMKSAKPILSVVTLDSILNAHAVTKAQRTTLYGKMFVHVDLNRGTDAEFMLIPGVDAKKLTAIKAGRPWNTFDDFNAAMAKAMPAAEAATLEKYLFIPIELNTFTDAIADSFQPVGITTRWKGEFGEYRPWKSMEQFDREIGKYVRGRPTELNRLKRYVIIM